jgi:hypothetical protein
MLFTVQATKAVDRLLGLPQSTSGGHLGADSMCYGLLPMKAQSGLDSRRLSRCVQLGELLIPAG